MFRAVFFVKTHEKLFTREIVMPHPGNIRVAFGDGIFQLKVTDFTWNVDKGVFEIYHESRYQASILVKAGFEEVT